MRRVRRRAVTDAYERWGGHLPRGWHDRLGHPAAPARPRTVPRGRARARLHRALGLRHRPGSGARAGLPRPGRLRGPAHRLPRPCRQRPGRRARAREPAGLHPRHAARRRLARAAARGRPRPRRDAGPLDGRRGDPRRARRPARGDARGCAHASVSSPFTENLDQVTIPNRPEAAQRLADRSAVGRRTRTSTAGCPRAPSSAASPSRCSCTTARTTAPARCRGPGVPTGCCAPPTSTPRSPVRRRAARLHPAVGAVDGAHGALPAAPEVGLGALAQRLPLARPASTHRPASTSTPGRCRVQGRRATVWPTSPSPWRRARP